MNRVLFLIIMIFVILTFSACTESLTVLSPINTDSIEDMEVFPITLKYCIVDTLHEIYQANIFDVERRKEFYENSDKWGKNHYEWLIATYNQMPKDMKKNLNIAFRDMSTWTLMNNLSILDNDAGLDDIKILIESIKFSINQNSKRALVYIIDEFYNRYFKTYFEDNLPVFESLAKDMNEKLASYDNPVDIISDYSGIYLGEKKCVFFYTLRKVGAYLFKVNDLTISTLQYNADEPKYLFRTALHENSHPFFQTFTKTADFKDLAYKIKNIKAFYNFWNDNESLKASYTWTSFLEENLVEGFAKFLSYKIFGESGNPTYYYDYPFYEFLLEKNFSPEKYTLEEISYMFYELQLKKQE